MKTTHLLGLMLAAGVIFTGCGKDDEDNNSTPTQTKTQMLTAKNYKMTGLTLQGADVFNQPGFGPEACEKDDLLKFNTNMTFTYTDAGDTCSTNGSYSGSWMLMDNDSKLRRISDGDTIISTITQLDASTLKLSSTEDFGGTPVTAVETYTAQ